MGSPIRKSKERTLIVGLLFTLGLSILIFRLFWLQTVASDSLNLEARKNWIKDQELQPKRGTIFDRTHQQSLAWEQEAYVFGADLVQMKNPKEAAKLLAPVLKVSEDKLYSKLSLKPSEKRKAVELRFPGRYKYDKSVFQKIQNLKSKYKTALSPIYAFPTTKRHYIDQSTSHVLGFLNSNDQPVGGIESYYHNLLRGKQGKEIYKQTKDGIMIDGKPLKLQPPVQGKDLVLTLDMRIQHQVAEQLDEAMKNYQAKGGTAVIADPNNGEILAMVSRPTFDPNNTADTYDSQKNGHNMAVESQFEPGSTFKIVTLAAAIEERLFNPQEKYQSGAIKVEDRVIHDWKPSGWGEITFREGVELSSNVAFVKLGQRLGMQNLVRYIDKFGFGDVTKKKGRKTGIDLPAEASGYYYDGPLYPTELATVAFGQGLSVTPIQQVMAVSAIANGGTLYKPHLLKEVWDPEKKKKINTVQAQGKRIISATTAEQVRKLLRDVVRQGTGLEADVPGYQVAGKTGTAQKPKPDGSGYLPNKYIVSFIGFAPADKPAVVVYIALDEPQVPEGSATGGSVAAPLASKILQNTLKIKDVDKQSETSNLK